MPADPDPRDPASPPTSEVTREQRSALAENSPHQASTPSPGTGEGPAPPDRDDTVAAHRAKGDRRPPDTIWRQNPREQGLIGLTDAVAWFGAQGWSVCLPLIDSQPYDLVVDDGEQLLRVQVKTTTARNSRGTFVVSLCTNGGNQSFHTKKNFDPRASDLLYVLTDDRDRFVIPTEAITARASLTLGERVRPYKVAQP